MSYQGKRTELLNRKGALFTERSSFFSHWQDLSRFLLPRSGRFVTSDRNKGDKRWNNIYDNTGTRALGILAAGLQSGMTSPARPWFRLGLADKALMDSGPVKQWLRDVTELMQRIFSKSNTYRALHGQYEEIGLFGTGCNLVLSDFDDVIRHYPMTVGEYALATNDRQEVDTMVREYENTVSQIVRRYGLDQSRKSGSINWDNISGTVKNLYDRGNLDTWVPLLHIIEPREDRIIGRVDNKNMAFKSVTFEPGCSEEKFLNESGFRHFPVMAPRWHALGGDVYATRCPGMEALGDVKQLQHGQLRKAQALDYLVKPAMQVPHGTKSYETDFLPGGVTVTDMMNGSGAKTAFEVKPDLSGQLEDIRDIRERVKDTFFANLFMMIAMDDKNQPDTARAIAEKHEEKLLMLGPVLERLHNEMLKPFIDMTFDKMIEADLLPPPPEEMHGAELNIEFVSVLAQAQRAIGTQAIDRYVMSMGAIAQFKPDVLDKFDSDQWADKYGDLLGVDPDLIVANDKVAIVRENRAKQAAAAQQMAAAEQMANTAKTASQAQTQQPSVLTDVMSGLTGYSGPGPSNTI